MVAPSIVQALAWMLVHFVWQGALVGLAALVCFRVARTPAVRHAVGVLALMAMLGAPLVTFAYLAASASSPGLSVALEAGPAPQMTIAASGSDLRSEQAAPAASAPRTAGVASGAPYFVLAWLMGVTILSLRLLGGWIVARRLVHRAVRPVTPEIRVLVRRVAGRLALDRIVHVVESTAVAVPMMVGWIKPVVLLPAVALSGLTPQQIEALVAHELAHVRRHDYLVNLLQAIAETLLFYHPAVWAVSRQVRREREQCCDDLAIGVCDRFVYATALADLAAISGTPRLALAATDGSLVERVRRILGHAHQTRRLTGWLPGLIVLLVVGALIPLAGTAGTNPAAVRRSQETAPNVIGAALPASQVQSGVPGGVSGGVAGGVPGGVASGVAGGISSGLAGGVSGGVPGGVAGGVVDGISRRVNEYSRAFAEVKRAENETNDRIAEIQAAIQSRQHLADVLKVKLADAAQQGRENDLQQLRAQIRRLEEEVRAARRELERQRMDLDKLTAKREELLEARQGFESKLLESDLEKRQRSELAQSKLFENALKDFPKLDREKTERFEKEMAELFEKEMKKRLDDRLFFEKGGELERLLDDRGKAEAIFLENRRLGDLRDFEVGLWDRSEPSSEATRLMDQVRSTGVTAQTADKFFQEVVRLTSSSDRRHVLEIVAEQRALPEAVVLGYLKTAATISDDRQRAEALIMLARHHQITGSARALYLSAADGIRSEYDQTRALAELVRSERIK